MRYFAIFFALFFPAIASAHAFGTQFTLPLPVRFYIVGGTLAFVASCAVLMLFSEPAGHMSARLRTIRVPGLSKLAAVLSVLGLVLAGVIVFLAIAGSGDFTTNPAPNIFWVLFLLLFAYMTAVVGGLWKLINPFHTICSAIVHSREREAPRWLPYVAPALFFVLLWIELMSGYGAIPVMLAVFFCFYLALCIVMSFVFGVQTWFAHGEYFNMFFGLIGKVAPVQLDETSITLSLPGERLAFERAPHIAVLLFILVMLGSTVVDGLRETRAWWDFIFAFNLTSPEVLYTTELLLLLTMPFFLFGLFALALSATKLLTRIVLSVPDLMLTFAYSLLPIAIAYHFAHYFTLILSSGQQFIAQVSDPLHRGLDVFGTAQYQINPALIEADSVWYIQLSVIVLGHVLAAVVSHRIARRLFPTTKGVILSQLPMIVLMVFYTAFGLWTLAQPFMAGA